MLGISAKTRQEIGKKVGALRREGVIPAVLYGEGVAATPLSVPEKEFEKVFKQAGETSLIEISIDGGKRHNVLIYDVAKDPQTLQFIHADFYAVRMDKPIEAKVPLVFSGESPAVKNEGGILVKVLHELEVEALPKDLPHEIVLHIDGLSAIGDKMHVRDITLPAGVHTKLHPEDVAVLIEAPRAEAELEELAAKPEEVAPVAEVKTEREVKAEAKAAKAAEEAAAEE